MKRWHGSCLSALLVLLVCGGSMLFIVPIGGGMLVGIPPVFDKITGLAVCPGAVTIDRQEYNSGPVSADPMAGFGHQEEWTCTFMDGSQKVVPNEEIALKGIGASFTVIGVLGGVIVIVLMIVAAIVGGRLVKPKVDSFSV